MINQQNKIKNMYAKRFFYFLEYLFLKIKKIANEDINKIKEATGLIK